MGHKNKPPGKSSSRPTPPKAKPAAKQVEKPTGPGDTVRLNRFVADCTGMSRRAADEAIAAGAIKVNRKPATVGMAINPRSDIVVHGGQRLEPRRKRTIVFHKPKGAMTTRQDPEGRQTIYDVLPEEYQDLDPVGRLDRDSTGVLLLTNDGELLNRLTHPRYGHSKEYRVRVDKPVTEALVAELEAGVMLMPENQLAKCTVKDVPEPDRLVLILKTGLNRQIRRSLMLLGYTVMTLKRIRFAHVELGDLKPGAVRPLKPGEMKVLGLARPSRMGQRPSPSAVPARFKKQPGRK